MKSKPKANPPDRPEPSHKKTATKNHEILDEQNQEMPGLEGISGISAPEDTPKNQIDNEDLNLQKIGEHLVIPVNNPIPPPLSFGRIAGRTTEIPPIEGIGVDQVIAEGNALEQMEKKTDAGNRTIYVKTNSRKKRKNKNGPKTETNSFLEDFDFTDFQNKSFNQHNQDFVKNDEIKIYNSSMMNTSQNQLLRPFSFRNSGIANSKDLNSQSFFKKKKKQGHFTEINNQHFDQPLVSNNDTSINVGLPPIPHTNRVQFPNQNSIGRIPSVQANNSFQVPRNYMPPGSNTELFSNMKTSFQKLNESGFNEILVGAEKSELLQSNYPSFNNPVLENLNTSFKDYNNPANTSFNLDRNMNRLERIDNSFNFSVQKPGQMAFQKGLNDTLNQSGQFNLKQPSRTNLDTSYQAYYGAPKENMLNTIPQSNEMDISELKSGNDQNTSFDQIPQNILSLLDHKNSNQKIQIETRRKSRKKPQKKLKEISPIKEKFFMDPEERESPVPQVHGKLKRVEQEIQEEKSEGNSGEEECKDFNLNLDNINIIEYILKNYNSECIRDVVNAKCAKYKKGTPDIYKIINYVISKNKRWKNILKAVQRELAKKDDSSDSDNQKSTFSITAEQEKDSRKIVNKININFNTEVKYQASPRQVAKYLKNKEKIKKRKKKRWKRKAHNMEEGLKKRRTFKKKTVKLYSERYSSSNGSDSSDQNKNYKRVKQDSNAQENKKMFESFNSERKLESFDPKKMQIENFMLRAGPSEDDKSSVTVKEEVVTVVRNPNKVIEEKKEQTPVKRKRGRPKGSKNSKNPSVISNVGKESKRKRGRKRKRSYKEKLKDIILNDGESYGMNSDLDSRLGIRSRRSRRKKSDIGKSDDNFVEMRGVTKIIFDILRFSFTEMSIKTQEHADFLNSNVEEAKVLKIILRKKFDLKEEIVISKLKMIKEKKRNEEINKFVVKRCMKFLMKRNRDNTRLSEEVDSKKNVKNKKNDLKKENKELLNELKLENPQKQDSNDNVQESVFSLFNKDKISKDLKKHMGSMSQLSLTEANKQTNLSGSKMIQSDFPDFNDLNDGIVPDTNTHDVSLQYGVFGPAIKDFHYQKFEKSETNFPNDQANINKILNQGEPKESNKMLAHSKLLSEHQFYKRFFQNASFETQTPLAKYYLPNTKLANNANKENKGNKQAQSFKTINIKYIRLILHSRIFARSIRDFLEQTFEFEYRETRLQKLKLLAKSINNPKYIKSVKLPWTMHEINEAKSTFLNLIETTENDIKKNSVQALSQFSQKTISTKSKKKKMKSPMRIPERRNTRSRTRSRRASPINQEENFQACFASSNKSNKFRGN